MPDLAKQSLRRFSERLGFERDWYLIVLGALVGALTAVGAVGFAKALHFAEHWTEEAITEGGPGAFGLALVVAIPAGGALLTGLLVHFGARDARGHGVPQVMGAIITRRGVIPLRVGLVKVAASICTVGSGGSAGAEGPIIQIGSTAGSVFGQALRASREHMGTLVGCGAAAGIASIFNAPIAGVFFVLEILLRDFSLRTFAPIVVAAVLSTATTQALLGQNEAIFAVSEQFEAYRFHFSELPSYVLLGIFCGVIAVAFGWLLHRSEDTFARLKLHPILKPVLGAVLLGGLGLAFLLVMRTGSGARLPPFFGNGYPVIESLLEPALYVGEGAAADGQPVAHAALNASIGLIVVLLVCKAVGTVLTLGSGGSGGVFAPSLFLGATAGAGFGMGLSALGLIPEGGSPASYALVGMAAVVAGSTHAPLTAILMLFELTQEYKVLAPVMLAAIIATVVAQLLSRDSIYTATLRRKGLVVGTARDLTLLRRIPVTSVTVTPLPPEPVYASDPLSKLVTLHAYHSVPDFVVVDQSDRYVGMVAGADMRSALIDREAIPLLLVAELVRTDLPVVLTGEHLDTVMDKFSKHDVSSLPLAHDREPNRPIGLLTRSKLMRCYQEALEQS